MIRARYLPLLLLLSLCAFAPVRAAIRLTADPGATDLRNLVVGETVTIQVQLVGLDGLELSSLGAGIEFSDAHFGAPQNAAPGSIVPEPTDLILTALPGLMDSQFFAFGGSNIASEGDFFSFDLTAQSAGSGSIRFDGDSLFYEDQDFNPEFGFGINRLLYTINEAPTDSVVPEPVSCITFAGLGLCFGIGGWLRRRRA
jgi:hypothetical protein